MPRKQDEEHTNHERWLISYADFITLLFAFFVVMFASSQADKNKVRAISESVARALEEDRLGSRVLQVLGAAGRDGTQRASAVAGVKEKPQQGQTGELLPALQRITSELQKEIDQGKLQVSMDHRGLVISLKQAAFFPTGDATIAAGAYSIMERLAAVILRVPNAIRLEGHTDAILIHNERFASNWELSAARAIAMLNLLCGKFRVPSDRMSVAGYAETKPVDVNNSESGRSRNRRVDIIILNQASILQEPGRRS